MTFLKVGWLAVWLLLGDRLLAQSYQTPAFNFDRGEERAYVDSLILATKGRIDQLNTFKQSPRLDTARMELLHFLVYVHQNGWTKVSRDSTNCFINQLIRLAQQKKNIKFQIKGLLRKDLQLRAYEGKYPEAIQVNFQLVKLVELSPADYNQYSWRVYRNLGLIYQEIGSLTEALEYLTQSITYTSKDAKISSLQIADLYKSVGMVYLNLRQFDKAERFYLQALDTVNKVGANKANSAYLFEELGRLYKEQGRLTDAVIALQQAITLWEQIKSYSRKCNALAALSDVYLKLKQYDEAIEYAKLALRHSPRASFIPIISNNVLAKAYAEKQDWQTAYQYEVLYSEKRAEVQTTAIQADVMRQKAIFEKERLETDFQQEKVIREQQFRTQQTELKLKQLRLKSYNDRLLQLAVNQSLRYQLETSTLKAEALKKANRQQNIIKHLNINNLQTALANQQRQQKLLFWGILIISVLSILLFMYNLRLQRKNREISEAMLKGQKLERRRFAADLHDNLGGMMSAIRLSIEAMDTSTLSRKEKEVYGNVLNMTRQAYNDVRLLAHNLQPEELEKFGLPEALQRLVHKLRDSQLIHFSLITNDLARLSKELEFNLYSICLELTNNIIRHSQATEATFEFVTKNGQLQLFVTDNGQGFIPNNTSDGMGMRTVQERTEQMGGTLKIHSQPGEGTMFQFSIPLTLPTHVSSKLNEA